MRGFIVEGEGLNWGVADSYQVKPIVFSGRDEGWLPFVGTAKPETETEDEEPSL